MVDLWVVIIGSIGLNFRGKLGLGSLNFGIINIWLVVKFGWVEVIIGSVEWRELVVKDEFWWILFSICYYDVY